MVVTYVIGKVDDVDGRYIATKFFSIIGPLFPLGSMFVARSSAERRGNATVFRYQGTPVRLHPLSVALGYLRVWLPIVAAIYPFATHWGERLHFGLSSPWIEVAAILALWLVLLFVPGRLSTREKAKLRVLAAVTGLPVDPRWLLPAALKEQLDRLRASAPSYTRDPAACLEAIGTARGDLASLYAFARYAAVTDPAWQRVADAIWPRVEAAPAR